jgi:hypothetical protein
MLKANIEFDNFIASSLSPIMFLQRKVFGDNVFFREYNKKTKEAIFDVYSVGSLDNRIMEIRLKNFEQI